MGAEIDAATFVAGIAVGAAGLALAFWLRLRILASRAGLDGARLTFHRPREGVLVVEVRQDLSATYAASLRDWLQQVEGEGTAVLLVCLGDRP